MTAPLPVWLASYPKSGSTWFRLMARQLSAPAGQALRLDDVGVDGETSADAVQFEASTLLDPNLLTGSELELLLPGVRRRGAVESPVATNPRGQGGGRAATRRLIKCHDAWTVNSAGAPLLGGRGAASAAILLVRDPRDVAVSLAAHHGQSVDETIVLMGSPEAFLGGPMVANSQQLRQPLSTWSGHAQSWLAQDEVPVHLLRYEDMLQDPAGAFRAALRFARIASTPERCRRAAAACTFGALQRQERESGFAEVLRSGDTFFRSGQAGAWRRHLSAAQVDRIQRDHGVLMLRLGYGLAQ